MLNPNQAHTDSLEMSAALWNVQTPFIQTHMGKVHCPYNRTEGCVNSLCIISQCEAVVNYST